MFFYATFYLACFSVLNLNSNIYAEETLVEILKKKIIGLDESLTMDIRLLRRAIERNSEEFDRLSKLLDETRVPLNAGEIHPIADPDSQTKQIEVMHDFEHAMDRVKRAFAEEKAGLKKFTFTMKTEINQLSNEISKALSDFRISHVETKKEFMLHLDSFKIDLTSDLNQALTDLAMNLTNSVKSMSRDLVRETNKAATAMEKTSENFDMVSGIQNSVQTLSRNMSETSEHIYQIKDQLGAFEDKFDKLYGLRLKTVKEYFVDNVRLKNISQTINTIAGRLEVKHDDQWGNVCDDDFGMSEAGVACRMLGFSSADSFKHGSHYGRGMGPIWLDDLSCSGTETSLFDCGRYEGVVSSHNCGHSEDVGVICNY